MALRHLALCSLPNMNGMGKLQMNCECRRLMLVFSVSRLWNVAASISKQEQVSCLLVSSLIDTRLLCAKGKIHDSKVGHQTHHNAQMATLRTSHHCATLNSATKQCMQRLLRSTTTTCCSKCMLLDFW